MQKSGLKHNAKRNPGLIYEMLVRHLLSKEIDDDVKEAAKVVNFISENFALDTLLNSELELFSTIVDSRVLSESSAKKLLGEVGRVAKSVDKKKLDVEKSKLIAKLNRIFGKNFLSEHRIPNYRLYATVQVFLDDARRNSQRSINESKDAIDVHEALTRYLTGEGRSNFEFKKPRNIDGLTCAMAVQKFKKKYGKQMNKKQFDLVEKYVKHSVANDLVGFRTFLDVERNRIAEKLIMSRSMREFIDDRIMRERLDESISMIKEDRMRNLDDEVNDVLLYYRLEEEISSDD